MLCGCPLSSSMNQLEVYTDPVLLELPLPSPPSRSSQSTKLSSQYYAAASDCLPVLHMALFPDGSGKESACNIGDTADSGWIPGSGRSPGEGMTTHSSILAWRIPKDRVTWRATVQRGHNKSDTTEHLSKAQPSLHLSHSLLLLLCPHYHFLSSPVSSGNLFFHDSESAGHDAPK